MDIEELKKLVESQKKTIDQLNSKAESANEEVERMRGHQANLLEEVKNAKKARNEANDALAALKAKVDELENKGLVHDGNYEELLAKQTEKLKLKYEEQLAESTKAVTDISAKFEQVTKKYETEKINAQLRKAAEAANVLPSAIDDVIYRANGVFNIGEDGSIEARDKDGNLMKVGKRQLTPDTFVDNLKESAPHFWPPSQGAGATGGGAGGKDVKNPWMKDSFNRTAQVKIANENPDLAKQFMEEAKAS